MTNGTYSSTYNSYTDPEQRKKRQSTFMQTMQPQITQGVNTVTSQINPRMIGKTGASLLRNVYNPATQALAGHELEQEKLGTQYEAERPWREAALLGKLGGEETLQGRSMGLQEELGRGQLGISQGQLELSKQMFNKQYTDLTAAQKAQVDQMNKENEMGLWEKGGSLLGTVLAGEGGLNLGGAGEALQNVGNTVGGLFTGGGGTAASGGFDLGGAATSALSNIAPIAALKTGGDLIRGLFGLDDRAERVQEKFRNTVAERLAPLDNQAMAMFGKEYNALTTMQKRQVENVLEPGKYTASQLSLVNPYTGLPYSV